MPATSAAPQHDWLGNAGGSIGIALPLAVGAAVAAPDRRVLCLTADGSAIYTLQALWTMRALDPCGARVLSMPAGSQAA